MRVTLVRDPELGRDAVEAVRAAGLGPLLRRCGDALAEGGSLFVFEHNPLNPLTRYVFERCVFDRAGYLYHGRVKALADGARQGGLKF